MDEKFMKVLREQQEIQQKAARILHDTEKMKEEVQNKLESLKRKVENDLKNIGEFLKEANVQFATYEYIFQEDDCKRIQINEQKYQTCIYVVVNQHKIYLGPSKAEDESCFHFSYKTGICTWDSCTDSITTNCSMYICTHWKSIYTFIQNNLIKNVQKNNQTILQETLNKRDIVYRKLEELSGVRRLITEIEQYGIYALAFLIFKEKGILCNQSWLSERIKPILDRDYPADLSDTTFSYMKIDTKIEQYITNQDWSHLDDGPITFSEYKNFYDDLSEYITEFQATPFYSTSEQKQDMDLFIQKLECINYALYGTDKLSMSDSIVELMAKEYMSFCDSIRNTQMYFEGINQTAEATMQFLVYLASKYTQNKNLLSRGVDEEKLYIVSQELSVINQHAYRAKITELRNLMRSKEPGYIDFHMFSETSPKEYLDVIRVTTGCYGSNESVYFLNLVRLCAYTKKEIKKVILSTKSYTEKDLVDLPTIIDQWKNEYRSDRSLAWPTL